jgi:hypothetical protein
MAHELKQKVEDEKPVDKRRTIPPIHYQKGGICNVCIQGYHLWKLRRLQGVGFLNKAELDEALRKRDRDERSAGRFPCALDNPAYEGKSFEWIPAVTQWLMNGEKEAIENRRPIYLDDDPAGRCETLGLPNHVCNRCKDIVHRIFTPEQHQKFLEGNTVLFPCIFQSPIYKNEKWWSLINVMEQIEHGTIPGLTKKNHCQGFVSFAHALCLKCRSFLFEDEDRKAERWDHVFDTNSGAIRYRKSGDPNLPDEKW